MRSTQLLLASLLLGGCASANSGPTVAITFFGDPWSKDDMARVESGSEVWDRLGFLYILDPDEKVDMEVCPHDWAFRRLTECKIRVGVQQVPDSSLPSGAAAFSDRSTGVVSIGASFHGEYLVHLGAHEFGHVLLNTAQHLPPGVPGIMQSGSGLTEPTVGDWALACISTGICEPY